MSTHHNHEFICDTFNGYPISRLLAYALKGHEDYAEALQTIYQVDVHDGHFTAGGSKIPVSNIDYYKYEILFTRNKQQAADMICSGLLTAPPGRKFEKLTGNELRSLLLAYNISNSDLARQVVVSRQAVDKWVYGSGNVPTSRLDAISDYVWRVRHAYRSIYNCHVGVEMFRKDAPNEMPRLNAADYAYIYNIPPNTARAALSQLVLYPHC